MNLRVNKIMEKIYKLYYIILLLITVIQKKLCNYYIFTSIILYSIYIYYTQIFNIKIIL